MPHIHRFAPGRNEKGDYDWWAVAARIVANSGSPVVARGFAENAIPATWKTMSAAILEESFTTGAMLSFSPRPAMASGA